MLRHKAITDLPRKDIHSQAFQSLALKCRCARKVVQSDACTRTVSLLRHDIDADSDHCRSFGQIAERGFAEERAGM